jgi:hypothetical protein
MSHKDPTSPLETFKTIVTTFAGLLAIGAIVIETLRLAGTKAGIAISSGVTVVTVVAFIGMIIVYLNGGEQ